MQDQDPSRTDAARAGLRAVRPGQCLRGHLPQMILRAVCCSLVMLSGRMYAGGATAPSGHTIINLSGLAAVSGNAATAYAGPLVITRGGTYSGSWESHDATTAAVRIDTREPVTLTHCRLRGPGPLIHAPQPGAHLTIRHCTATGLTPDGPGLPPGRFLAVLAPRAIEVTHNTIQGTSGIYVDGARTATERVVISRNRASNIDGRHSNGRGGFMPGFAAIHFLQLNNVRAVHGAEIAWNEVINLPGQSRVEDNINIYQSRGTAVHPIRIHDNYIQGAYPANPLTESFSGGGIVIDGPAGDAALASAHVAIENNQVVSTTNYGIGVASGNHIVIRRNVVVFSGRLPGSKLLAAANVGLYVWDMNGDRARGGFFDIEARDNQLGWVRHTGHRADAWTPDCPAQACQGNLRLTDPITIAVEEAQYPRWREKLATAGIVIGAEDPQPVAKP